jgi:hypothetical protein
LIVTAANNRFKNRRFWSRMIPITLWENTDILPLSPSKSSAIFTNPVWRISHHSIHLAQRREHITAIAQIKRGIPDALYSHLTTLNPIDRSVCAAQ